MIRLVFISQDPNFCCTKKVSKNHNNFCHFCHGDAYINREKLVLVSIKFGANTLKSSSSYRKCRKCNFLYLSKVVFLVLWSRWNFFFFFQISTKFHLISLNTNLEKNNSCLFDQVHYSPIFLWSVWYLSLRI